MLMQKRGVGGKNACDMNANDEWGYRVLAN